MLARRSYTIPLPSGASLALGERCLVMGVLNVTPDSFSDTSPTDAARAIDAALAMEAAGADLIDIGGESTRPGADAVPAPEESARILPVIAGLAGTLRIPMSVDTYKAGVARAAIGQIPLGERSLAATERMLAILRAAGLPDQVVAYAADLIPLYVCAVAFEEAVQGASNWSPADIEHFVSELRGWFGALPADRFPHIVALAGPLTTGAGDDRFEFGVQVIVAGLASFLP